jgi:hypothetical protein
LISASNGEATRWRFEDVAWWVQLVTHQDPHEFIDLTVLRKEQVWWTITDHRGSMHWDSIYYDLLQATGVARISTSFHAVLRCHFIEKSIK